MSDPRFRVSLSHPAEDVVLVTVVGEVDVCSSTSLREQLQRVLHDETRSLIVDLAGVPFMDSSGLGCLMGAAKRAIAAGSRLLVVAPRRHVRHVFGVMGIDGVIPVCSSLDEAMALAQA